MPAERYYYPKNLENDQAIVLKDQEQHHLVNVMRTRLGEEIEVVNGMGQLGKAILESIEKKSVTLRLESVFTETPSSKKLILAQGIPKQNRLEFIIEKCTELGMSEIWLFPASLSEKKDLSANQLERLQTLMIAAMKQCGRLFLPKIVIMPPLKQWKNIEVKTLFFGDVKAEAVVFMDLWQKLEDVQSALFCIGPESGFSDEEVSCLVRLGAHGVKLHSNILRTETAAIASIALMSHLMLGQN